MQETVSKPATLILQIFYQALHFETNFFLFKKKKQNYPKALTDEILC